MLSCHASSRNYYMNSPHESVVAIRFQSVSLRSSTKTCGANDLNAQELDKKRVQPQTNHLAAFDQSERESVIGGSNIDTDKNATVWCPMKGIQCLYLCPEAAALYPIYTGCKPVVRLPIAVTARGFIVGRILF